MAVESRHVNFFDTTANINPYNNNNNNNNNGFGLPPLSGTTTESFVPMYNNNGVIDSFPAKAVAQVKADSGLTYAHHLPVVSRKRSRESVIPMMGYPNGQIQNGNRCGYFTFLGEDVSLQIHHQQLEMDRLITQHNDKVRMEIEERRKRYSRRIIAAVEESITKRLKAKDDEIEKMVKLNWALEEKVKSVTMEAQIWRDLAHTNEAAAHALRANLEQVLNDGAADVAARADDAQSCCGSNYEGGGGEEEREDDCGGERKSSRMCRHCGEGVSSVLLLPCRHLCLCTVCGSSVHTCPLCNTPKNASVHVIMSS